MPDWRTAKKETSRGARRLRTEQLRRATKRQLQLIRDDVTSAERAMLRRRRPKTRGDCVDGPRPCPWVGCRYNLAVDVTKSGNLTLNFPDRDAPESCALDVAERGAVSGEGLGLLLNISRERVRQLLSQAIHKLRGLRPFEEFRDWEAPRSTSALEPDGEREGAAAALLRVG